MRRSADGGTPVRELVVSRHFQELKEELTKDFKEQMTNIAQSPYRSNAKTVDGGKRLH